jgi:hypothetical protein
MCELSCAGLHDMEHSSFARAVCYRVIETLLLLIGALNHFSRLHGLHHFGFKRASNITDKRLNLPTGTSTGDAGEIEKYLTERRYRHKLRRFSRELVCSPQHGDQGGSETTRVSALPLFYSSLSSPLL